MCFKILTNYAVGRVYMFAKYFAMQSALCGKCDKMNEHNFAAFERDSDKESGLQSRVVVKGYIISKESNTPLCKFSHKREFENNCLL